MSQKLTVFRAARLVGVSRTTLQKRIRHENIQTFEGEISVADLLSLYPEANLNRDSEYERVQRIKETAFSRRLAEAVLPDAETLAIRLSELGRAYIEAQGQLSRYRAQLDHVTEQLSLMESGDLDNPIANELLNWLKSDHPASESPVSAEQEILAYNTVLGIISAHIRIKPSNREFWLEGRRSILESAVQSGISLNYGCTSGNCGLCKARIVSGEVKKVRHHDYVLSEAEKNMNYVLLCSHTAVTDLVIEALEARDEHDIPTQQVTTRLKKVEQLNGNVLGLHLQTPRIQRLRFLAGQSVMLTYPDESKVELPIASCPCDDRNLLFHVPHDAHEEAGSSTVSGLAVGDDIIVSGPFGNFLLNENSRRTQLFIAFNLGFAPIKSLIEHAMAIDEDRPMHLFRVVDAKVGLYLYNLCRSWNDALDDFHYRALSAGDLRQSIIDGPVNVHDCDVYIAGKEAEIDEVVTWLLANGLTEDQLFTHILKAK